MARSIPSQRNFVLVRGLASADASCFSKRARPRCGLAPSGFLSSDSSVQYRNGRPASWSVAQVELEGPAAARRSKGIAASSSRRPIWSKSSVRNSWNCSLSARLMETCRLEQVALSSAAIAEDTRRSAGSRRRAAAGTPSLGSTTRNSRTNWSDETPLQRSSPLAATARAFCAKARTICANIQTSRRRRSLRAAPRCLVVEDAVLVEAGAERFAEDQDRVLKRGAEVRREVLRRADASASIVGARSGAGKSCSNARRSSRRRFAATPSSVALMSSRRALARRALVARGELARGHLEELALEAVAEQRARALPQVPGERARVGAKHAEDEVDDARGRGSARRPPSRTTLSASAT